MNKISGWLLVCIGSLVVGAICTQISIYNLHRAVISLQAQIKAHSHQVESQAHAEKEIESKPVSAVTILPDP